MIFFDIETASVWDIPAKALEKYGEKLNFMPEFNQIVSIAVWQKVGRKYVVKAIKWTEAEKIKVFFDLIKWKRICGFNIRNFDIPFIVKRALYHKIAIPNDLKFFGKKPWETDHIVDLFEIYKCNVWWAPGNMDLVSNFIWIKSSKDGWVDGSMVQELWDKWETKRINEYCIDDVQGNIDIYEYFKTYNLI